jgi:hypothetical protein
VEAVAGEGLTRRGGRLVIPASGATIHDDDIRTLRHADQR